MIEKRGTEFGAGMSLIALGDGVIDIEAIYNALIKVGFDGYTTLEVAGEEVQVVDRLDPVIDVAGGHGVVVDTVGAGGVQRWNEPFAADRGRRAVELP